MDSGLETGAEEPAFDQELRVRTAELSDSAYEKIELVWPGKDTVTRIEQMIDGQWQLKSGVDTHRSYPLTGLQAYPSTDSTAFSLAVSGSRLAALRTLGRSLGRSVRLAYVDAPRIGIDDANASFRGDPSLVYSSWLSVLRAHLEATEPLLRRDGILVLHVGENEVGFAKLLADEQFGRRQRVGTVVWQRAYAPRNMKGMREFTSTHDYLLIYARDLDALPPVGLRAAPEGYANPDGDPRGAWKAEHKGAKARRTKSDFDTFVPPYRWRIVEGRLPSGMWRLSPLTGVAWGTPTEIGDFPLTIEVADADGNTAINAYTIKVIAEGDAPEPPQLPWIFREIVTSGSLRIETRIVPPAIMNKEYSTAWLGAGGNPFRASPKRPGSGRYWEFADDTLVKAYQRDAVYLGRSEPTAIPHPKAYAPVDGELAIENQQTWWPGRIQDGKSSYAFAGYTEDATKHLKALKELGLVRAEASSAKPEHLLARLVDIFTDTGDLVLELFGVSGDLAAVALKRQRRFVLLAGSSERDLDFFRNCAYPRLCAVIDGRDKNLHEQLSEIRMRSDAYIPYEGGGSFYAAQVGDWLVERNRRDDFATLNSESYSTQQDLCRSLLTLEGYIPAPDQDVTSGTSIRDASAVAIVVPSNQFLTSELAAAFVDRLLGKYKTVAIYYFRCSADFDPNALPAGVTSKRVPFELGI
jgi:hypothetical protein